MPNVSRYIHYHDGKRNLSEKNQKSRIFLNGPTCTSGDRPTSLPLTHERYPFNPRPPDWRRRRRLQIAMP